MQLTEQGTKLNAASALDNAAASIIIIHESVFKTTLENVIPLAEVYVLYYCKII